MKLHLKSQYNKLNELYEQYELARMMGIDPREKFEMELQIMFAMAAKLIGFTLADSAIGFVELDSERGILKLLEAYNNPVKSMFVDEIDKLEKEYNEAFLTDSAINSFCADCEREAYICKAQTHETKKDPNHGEEVVIQYASLWSKFSMLTPLISAIAQKPNAMEIAKNALRK